MSNLFPILVVNVPYLLGEHHAGVQRMQPGTAQAKIHPLLCPGYHHAPQEVYCAQSARGTATIQRRKISLMSISDEHFLQIDRLLYKFM